MLLGRMSAFVVNVALTLTLFPRRSLLLFALTPTLSAKQITAWVDEGLDEHSYITPGLGDFGDR